GFAFFASLLLCVSFLSPRRQDAKAQSGRAAAKDPGPRMEHRLNTERESAQLHLERLFWESVFHPCSIRGSPENFVGNGRFLLIVVRIEQQAQVGGGLSTDGQVGCY